MSVWTIAEQFLKLNELYLETDVYCEKRQPFTMFSCDNPQAKGKDFDFQKFMENSSSEFWHCIKNFADSEIPNCFFTLPWDEFFNSYDNFSCWLENHREVAFAKEYLADKDIFSFIYDKIYWEYFAIILACRGAKNVMDVAKPILTIFADANRLGLFPLQCLVANNLPLFKDAIIECIYKAIDEGEDYWLDYLVSLLSLDYSFDGNAIKTLNRADSGYKDVLRNILSVIVKKS